MSSILEVLHQRSVGRNVNLGWWRTHFVANHIGSIPPKFFTGALLHSPSPKPGPPYVANRPSFRVEAELQIMTLPHTPAFALPSLLAPLHSWCHKLELLGARVPWASFIISTVKALLCKFIWGTGRRAGWEKTEPYDEPHLPLLTLAARIPSRIRPSFHGSPRLLK